MLHSPIKNSLSLLLLGACLLTSSAQADAEAFSDMVYIETGSYTPLFKQEDEVQYVMVDAFYLDRFQVTNSMFAQFIDEFPKWNTKNIKPIFADVNYLKQLLDHPLKEISNQPVTNISWFAAKAYCKSQSKRLPTTHEWEYAAHASEDKPDGSNDPQYQQKILQWYSKPSNLGLPDVDQGGENYWGVVGMHGVVWELVNDFNTSLVTGESRGDSQLENQLFCGAGAASSVDPGDYAAFMRYALRSSYEADYTLASLGFRCAHDASLMADANQ